jgi:hypothetical protein
MIMDEFPGLPDASIPPDDSWKPKPKLDRKTWFIIGGVIIIIAVYLSLMFIVPAIASSLSREGCGCTKVVAVSAHQPDNRTLVVLYQGGESAGSLNGITITVTDSSGQIQSKTMGYKGGSLTQCDWWVYVPFIPWRFEDHCILLPSPPPLPIGENVSFNGNFSGKDNIFGVAHFYGDVDQVVLDTNL